MAALLVLLPGSLSLRASLALSRRGAHRISPGVYLSPGQDDPSDLLRELPPGALIAVLADLRSR